MAKKTGRKCKVCKSRLREQVERLILEGQLGYRSIATWASNQGEDLNKDNIRQHQIRHMAGMERSVRIPDKRGQSSDKVAVNLNYHAMLRDLISTIYEKVDVEQLEKADMLKVLHLLARLTDLISKVEIRKIEGSAVVSKLLEARATGRFAGWIQGEEVLEEGGEEGVPKEL